MVYHFYCDESCHLPMDKDGLRFDGTGQVMGIGGVWCPAELVRPLRDQLRHLKQKHGLERAFEVKWTKVSGAKLGLYLDWIDLFYATPELRFRAGIVPDKQHFFRHHRERSLGGDHDHAYYSFYFDVLKVVLDPTATYNIFLDAKDTRGRYKLAELRASLTQNVFYEVPPTVIGRLQEIRSFEAELMQLADLVLGALTYVHRGLEAHDGASAAKRAIIEHLRAKSGYSLQKSTLAGEQKLNLWVWHRWHHPHDKADEKMGSL